MKFASIHGKIRSVANLHPDQIAIEHGAIQIRYDQLERRANQLADWMDQQATDDHPKVILFMEKSPELVIAILASLKSGTIFIPLDPNYPTQRLALMVEELEAESVLLFQKDQEKWEQVCEAVGGRSPHVLILDDWQAPIQDSKTGNKSEHQIRNPHAYIYFTSGSTGRPKGVLGRHKSLFHFIAWECEEMKIDSSVRFGQFTSPSFDPYLRDILVPLVGGATICIPKDQNLLMQPGRLVEWIDQNKISFFHMTPSLFKTLMAQVQGETALKTVQKILLAGEMLRGNDLTKFFQLFGSRILLGNLYGPTETTLAKFFYRVQPEDHNRVHVPVGKPIPGAQVLILDEQQERCRVGQVGEVYIRTPFISSGYYCRPELTRERFLSNPFGNHAKDVIYKTGDLGRILPSGDLELIGRKDQQVKVRGIRVEPGEIEQHLLAHPSVQESVVIARENEEGETYLIGYLVTDQRLTVTEIRTHLAHFVPLFMIPDYFAQLEQMPLNPNGKIDRQALPDPLEVVQQEREFIPPKGDLEERLAHIWQELLDVEQVSRYDHFFEMGGHSLRAVTLLAQICQEFQVELQLSAIFAQPILMEQAKLIDEACRLGYIDQEKNMIPKVEEQKYYPLSSGQERLFLLQQLEEIQTSYHIPNLVLIHGQLNPEKLQIAFTRLIERHEVLRSSFHLIAGEPVQKVHSQVEFTLEYFDGENKGLLQSLCGIQDLSTVGKGEAIDNFQIFSTDIQSSKIQELVTSFIRPFDLTHPPLLRAKVWQLSQETHLCLFDIHHIISDGTSTGNLIRELLAIYEGEELPELQVRYRDYAVWQRNNLQTEDFLRKEAFWLEQFTGTVPVLNLPTDRPRPPVQRYVGSKLVMTVDQSLVKKLEWVAQEEGVTLYMVLLAVYAVLLSKYSGEQDIVIGSPVAGRSHANLQPLVGMFINTLAFRIQLDEEWTIHQLLEYVKELTIHAFEHQDYPFETLVEKLHLRRDLSRNPLFDTMLILQNMEIPQLMGRNLILNRVPFNHAVSKMDLSLIIQPREENLEFVFEYSTDLFERETIAQFARYFLHLLGELMSEPGRRWVELDLLSAEEQQEQIARLNQTELQREQTELVHQLIAKQAHERPEQVAVVCGEQVLTYAMLEQRGNQIALMLRQSGVTAETVVGVLVERSVELLVTLLGVLKAGGAYLPLDPAYPEERLNYLLVDSGASLMVTNSNKAEKLNFHGRVIQLEDVEWGTGNQSSLEEVVTAENLAYLIYTSGSTGMPKGVMIEHHSLQNFIAGMRAEIDFVPEKTILSLTTVSFDIFFLETLLPLSQGMRVILGTTDEQQLACAFRKALQKYQVNLLQITPSRMQLFLQSGEDLSVLCELDALLLGGEPLPPALLDQIRDLRPERIYNLYGPTETTIWSSLADLSDDDRITIGRPIANTQIYLFNEVGQVVPPKVLGELYISGVGLARGYLKRPDLTAERFVVHPSFPGKRLYRTGDLARWHGDGQLEFLGRCDQQLKIRGYRIEPGEIETRLQQLPGIMEAVVVSREDEQGIAVLCGYLVLEGDLSSLEIKNQLAKSLPEYMVPTHLIQLEALPMTPNGKIDRKALPAPQSKAMDRGITQFVSPRTKLEEELVKIWSQVLGLKRERLGVYDHFFELGGHSLKAVQVVTCIRQELMVAVGMADLFQNPTIAQLAKVMAERELITYQKIPVLPERPDYPLSYSQQRLWLLEQKNMQTAAYHLSATYQHTGDLSLELLEIACQRLIQRHESLRTSFSLRSGEPVQVIWSEIELSIQEYDLSQVEGSAHETQRRIEQIHEKVVMTPFDLEQAPLLRVAMIRIAKSEIQIVFVMHHLVSDGWSMDIFQQELQSLYAALEAGEEAKLAPLPIQYRDFAHWQRQKIANEEMSKHRQFWQEQLGNHLVPLQLPTDYPYQSLFQDRQGASYRFQIATETVAKLKELAQKLDASLYMVLLAGYMTLLAQLADQEDVVVSSPVAGREHEDVKGLIGFFLNTLIFRGQIGEEMEFGQVLIRIRENTLQALEYQGYPFELFAQEAGLEQNPIVPSVTSLFFNMLNFATSGQDQFSPSKPIHSLIGAKMKFDLGCYVQEYANGLEIDCHYRTGLFRPTTIAYIMSEYQRLLVEIGENPWRRVAEFDLFSVTRLEEQNTLDSPITASVPISTVSAANADYTNTMSCEETTSTLVNIFEAQVSKYPEKLAVQGRKGFYTYRELNQIANRIAHELIAVQEASKKTIRDLDNQLAAVRENNLNLELSQSQVALLFEHDLELVAGILGVLKAGEVYVPLDPAYPEQRLVEILLDARVTQIVTNEQNLFLAKRLVTISNQQEINIINLNQLQLKPEENQNNPNVAIASEQLAYLLYTSGSTGKPKGVMQSHKNVLHFIRTYTRRLQISPDDNLTLFSSFGFDAAVMDIFGAILNGAALYIYNLKEDGNLVHLSQWLQEEQITIYHSIPMVFRFFVDSLTGFEKFPALRLLVMGGEALTKQDFDRYCQYFESHTQMINGLGPTESTVTLQYQMNQETEITSLTIPVGEPVEETEVFLWTSKETEARVYQVGELIYKSSYLAQGYWQRPEETAEVFGVDPRTGSGRIYRSGDLGVRLPDGKIQFVGRKDFQVKIRGYRIEVLEIEQALEKIPGICQAVVTTKMGTNRENRLIAYYRLDANVPLSIREIKLALTSTLPGYMIPTDYVVVEEFPQTATGKIDRLALPDPEGDNLLIEDYQPPQTKWERELAQLWLEVLELEKIDRRDDFFALGGHSLKAIALVARMNQEFVVEIRLSEIFAHPDLQGMASVIEQARQTKYQEISPVVPAEYYPVSSAQKRMFILHQMDPERIQYNMPRAMLVEGNLNRKLLKQAFQKLIQRHESLRTSFHLIEGEPVQQIHEQIQLTIEEEQMQKESVATWLKQWVRPFDLSQAPLIRVALVEFSSERFMLVYDLHHIISDGVSQVNLMNDFVTFYQGIEMEALPLQYKDYAHWQNKFLTSEKLLTQETYWLNQFRELPPALELPTDMPRPLLMSEAGDWYRLHVDHELTQRIYKLAHNQGATLYMVLLAAYHLWLTRYSGEIDTVVGLPIAGRSQSKDLEKLIGMFVNILPLRNQAESTLTFIEFLQQVKENALIAYEYQDYQFEMLVERLKLNRNLNRNPLFDTVLVLQNMEQQELAIPGLRFRPYEIDTQLTKFDLTLNVIEQDGELILTFYYCTDLFIEKTIARMGQHLMNIFREIVNDPEQELGQIQLLSPAEEMELIHRWDAGMANYPEEKTIHQLFAEQVAQRPEHVALTFKDQQMTYRELEERANQVAHCLRQRGVGPDQIVGLLLERSCEMMIGILAILKAGGAYLPIDPTYPMDRMKYILEDCGTEVLLTTKQVLTELKDLTFDGQFFDLTDSLIEKQSSIAPENINYPHDLAYIIYTSGSTGRPKGVMIEHQNVVRLLFNDQFQFEFTEQDIWSLFHSYCFDFSVWEMYGALLYGGRLVIVPKLVAQNPVEFLQVLKEEEVTVLNQTPTAFSKLIQAELERKDQEEKLQIRYVIFGGEALKPLLLLPWKERYPKARFINMYGITETTVHVTYKEITEMEIASNVSNIGTPIPTLSIYLMDEQMMLVPEGVVGEICVGGVGVARGYLNRPHLTTERFIANPYRPDERLYRSGDLARFLSNGELEYLGRLDRQVKIRGFRIELGEIEGRLLNHPMIQDTILIDRVDQSGDAYLCAYLVAKENTSELTIGELRAYVAEQLPDYMIPAYFMYLEEIPLTSNSKVDRQALPEPTEQVQMAGIEYLPPANQIENHLVEIWSEILQVEGIGVTNNFFELGGHSLKATSLVSCIFKEWQIELPLKEIFIHPTIRELADLIQTCVQTEYRVITPVALREYYPVSSAQKRLLVLQQLVGATTSYNLPCVLVVQGGIEWGQLERVINQLIQRHESLRTSFMWVEGEPVQKIASEVEFKVVVGQSVSRGEAEQVIQQFIRPFDLAEAPLFRVGLYPMGVETLLIFDLHHIIADGISLEKLMQEFSQLYHGEHLTELTLQYKEFSVWQQEQLQDGVLTEQERYWLEEFAQPLLPLELPLDYSRLEVIDFAGARVHFTVQSDLVERLEKLAGKVGVTSYMLLFTIYQILLAKYGFVEDLVVGTPIAGRSHPDLKDVLGMFVNTLPIRTQPRANKPFKQYLLEIKEQVLAAYANQDYPFDLLVEKLKLNWDLSRNPLFDTVFVLENEPESAVMLEDFIFQPYAFDHSIAKFDLTWRGYIRAEEIRCHLEYRTSLFKEETISQMAEDYQRILEQVVTEPEIMIGEVDVVGVVQQLDDVNIDDLSFDF